MAKLIVIEGPDAGNEHDLEGQEARGTFTAGRDPRAEIPLNDTAVSRRHFSVEKCPRGWRLHDLESRNQTYLNGEPAKDAFLKDGDIVRAGDTELRFESPGEPLEPVGVASTILKELPAGKPRDTLLERLASMESSLEKAGTPALSREDPREAIQRVRKLFDAYGEMAATSSSADLFQKLLAEAVPALGARRAAVVLREGDRWVVKASRSAAGGGGTVSVSASILEKVAGERKSILSANAREDALLQTGGSREGGENGEVLSVIAVPLITRNRASGVLYADRGGGSPPFTDQDLELLAALGDPAGSLLEKIEAEEDLRRENRNLFRSLTETKRIIGRSKATEEILELIRRAAPTPMTVLIQGETGTGKELVASAIHYASPRRGKPFVAINCAALPENLVESELFGHERGAFTGAVTRRKGRFELADTGTVFLDEVGELSLACQAKLLRLLEERQFERVGGVESVKVDVRVIAATNKDLLTAVAGGIFREDLFYRLCVLNVGIPPLRDRTDDISLLAQHFLDACGGQKKLGKAAEKKLLAYAWPGNVRQLKNALESAVVLGEGTEILPEDLILPTPPSRGAASSRGPRGAAAAGGADVAGGTGPWEPITLEELERIHILRVLEHTAGNKKRAAEMLGIERCTLYSKLRSYGVSSAKGANDE